MSNASQATPQRISLLNFIRQSNGGQFVIPIYQRNYTWIINPQLKKFLEDYENILNGNTQSHFLGIVMFLEISKGISFREMSIVDGQQRLATTFLMLYALKNIALTHSDLNIAGILEEQYLTNKFVDDEAKFRLKPLISDDEVYQKIISNQLSDLTDFEKKSNVYSNYTYIKSFLEKKLNGYEGNLKEIFDKLTEALNKMYIVYVPLLPDDNAQQIFESINSTGSPLLSSDLIRNFILMNLESSIQDNLYKKYWYPMEKLFDHNAKKIEEFFRFYLAMNIYELPNKNDIYNAFKKWFISKTSFKEKLSDHLSNENDSEQPLSLEEILTDFLTYAKIYYNIYYSTDEKLPKSIKNFRNNTSDMPAPFIMKIYSLHNNNQIDVETFDKIINLVDAYLMRRSIANKPTSAITRFFPSLLKQVLTKLAGNYQNIFEYTLFFLVNNNINKSASMPTDEEVTNYLLTNNAFVLGCIRAVLNKIELYENNAPVELKNLNIEHLMPQTPDQNGYWMSKISEGTYEELVNLLGNLTLATKWDNSRMGNKDWEHKKDILQETSHLKLNSDILKLSDWNSHEIKRRTNELINKIISIYPYQKSEKSNIKKWLIQLNTDHINTKGYLYENEEVEILQGSTLKKSDTELYNKLLEDEIIKEIEGKSIFIDSYVFSSISTAAKVILNSSRNGWDCFKDENGNSLNVIRTEIESSIV